MLISVLLFWCADSRWWGANGWLCRMYVTCSFLYCCFGVLTAGVGHQWLAVQYVCDMLMSVLLFWCADSRWWGANGWLCSLYVTCSFLYCCFGVLTAGGGVPMVGWASCMSHAHSHIAVLVC